jgi:signal transduction histidine kinase
MTDAADFRAIDPFWQTPVLAADDRLVGGVAAAVAREIGLAPTLVRAAFLLFTVCGGWGPVIYLGCWLSFPSAPSDPVVRVPKGRSDGVRLVGFVVTVASLAAILLLISPIWIGIGLNGLLLVAGVLFMALALSAPWWLRLARERDSERQARVRSDERAEVAAHLHDSVLQTLSLIQRNADDPQAMVTLARRQERELRNWLDPDRASRVGESIRGQLDQLATDVEELHGVPVEVVTAGDCLVDEGIAAALAATREATVNAAKHSGADQVDVYAEVSEDLVEFFVRDAGCGFSRDNVDEDRRGLKESIIGRMERAGGTAVVHSDPGEGTEVEISIVRRAPAPPSAEDDRP